VGKIKASIQFSTIVQLWAFRMELHGNNCEMNLPKLTMVCYCTREEISLATDKYHARLLEPLEERAGCFLISV
jgi:hypothetical protein